MPPIPLQEHLDRVLASVRPLPAREVDVADAWGLVLAQDVRTPLDLPVFTGSAMDGYAVRAADVAGAGEDTPVVLPVLGDIPAGDTRVHTLAERACWRIMTGAPVPDGADAVVPVEQTDGGTERVAVHVAVPAGASVRRRGEDLSAGAPLLTAGTLLLPHHVSGLAACGLGRVLVHPRPRVAVVTTGDELVPAGAPLRHGQIHDSNGPMLTALVRAAQAEPAGVVHVRDGDDLAARVDALVAAGADLVVTSGGVSAGAYEPVKDAYAAGGDIRFDAVAMQPGKPQGFGLLPGSGVPLLALPGNPVSSLVSFQVFVVPALRVLAGRSPEPERTEAVVEQGWRSPAGRLQLARVRLRRRDGVLHATQSGASGSHILGGLAAAQALALVPPEVTQVTPGDRLEVRPLAGEVIPDE